MKRRHILQSGVGGLVGIVRLGMYLSEDDNNSPSIFIAEDMQRLLSFNFSLNPKDKAYILLPFEDPINIQYIMQCKNNMRVSISTIKYESELNNEATYTRYPDISHEPVTSIAGSHTIPAGTGKYMLCFSNESESGILPFFNNKSTAEVRYDLRITTVSS
jgi:DNA-binding XRE family transcriptional regulator